MPSINALISALTLTLALLSSPITAAPPTIVRRDGQLTLTKRNVNLSARGGSGRMSYYGYGGEKGADQAYGSCGFEPSTVASNYVAMNGADYTRSQCGQCIKITSGDRCEIARIVDMCPGCSTGQIDVGMSVFSKLCDGGESQAVQLGIKNVNWEGPFKCGDVTCDSKPSAPAYTHPTPNTKGNTENECTDVYPYHDGYTCGQQASWKKCTMWWLHDYCNRSCGRCGTGTAH